MIVCLREREAHTELRFYDVSAFEKKRSCSKQQLISHQFRGNPSPRNLKPLVFL